LYPARFIIEGIPEIKDNIANRCVPVSAYIILKFYDITDRLGFDLMTYEEFLELFPKGRRLGYPPGQLDHYFSKSDDLTNISIGHKKANQIEDLYHILHQNQPVILVYDHHYYHTQVPSKNKHTSVLTGYTLENIIINDSFHGKGYSLERNSFNRAWELKQMRYILIKPPKPSLRRWMPE